MESIGFDDGLRVNVMLADYAQVADGKLNVLGGGWSVTGPDPSPFAIAGLFEVPWHLADQLHTFRFELIDMDGTAVMCRTPDGMQEVFFEGSFELGHPADAKPGSVQRVPFALNGGMLPLEPGTHYEWRLSVDGGVHDGWRLPFATRSREA